MEGLYGVLNVVISSKRVYVLNNEKTDNVALPTKHCVCVICTGR